VEDRRRLLGGALLVAVVAVLVVIGFLLFGPSRGPHYPGPLQVDLDDLEDTGPGDTPDRPADPDLAVDPPTDLPEVTASTEVSHDTVWLCGPEAADDACVGDLDATVVTVTGSRTVVPFEPADDPPVDCFYLYPTVSEASGTNAPLEVTDAERDVARAQAARFGEVCRVVAPIYRQVTREALLDGGFTDAEARDLAFADVVSAWNDHVAASGDRPFVLLGHSQGAYDLTRLLADRIEGDPALRPRLVSALLLGAEVTVPVDADVGGSFATVPPCRDVTDTGCVVAYNSYPDAPPANAIFGRGGYGEEVLCTHPSALAGGDASLTPALPVPPGTAGLDTPFVILEGLVTAACRSDGPVSWLQVEVSPLVPFDLASVRGELGPAWGLHVVDVNVALGDLVELVRAQVAAAS
jgi:hypothetical protein